MFYQFSFSALLALLGKFADLGQIYLVNALTDRVFSKGML